MKSRTLSQAIALALLPGLAAAQEGWEGSAAIYGFFPDISARARHAVPGGGEIVIDANDLIRNTELAFFTSVEARKGRVGLFGDLIYMDVGDELAGSTTLGQGTIALPPGITADTSAQVEAAVLTLAGTFRLVGSERQSLDAFAGVRGLAAESTLDATLNSPIGPVASASSTVEDESFDAILGVKGKVSLGSAGNWYLPWYVDVGTGDADRTAQGVLGIGYSLKRGDVFGTYRYLDYDLQDDGLLSSLDLSGPAVGFAFRF
jgi:hypothetical protein